MTHEFIVHDVSLYYPSVQAIYLFGSWGTQREWPDSDIDIALLLPAGEAHAVGSLAMSALRFSLETQLRRDVDLVNLRCVSTVFQNEIINSGRLLLRAESEAVYEFEMHVLSSYQKLNEERREILNEFFRTKRAYTL